MTDLTLNAEYDKKIYSEILKAINEKRGIFIKKINIFIFIINFLLILSLLISAIYIKNNDIYFFIIIPIALIIIFPLLLLKINTYKQIEDIQKFVNGNNELISALLNKEININKFKIKKDSKMYGKNKNFVNEIINQTIKQLREL